MTRVGVEHAPASRIKGEALQVSLLPEGGKVPGVGFATDPEKTAIVKE